MADPGEGPGGPGPPLFFDQNEAPRAEKIFLQTGSSLSEGDLDPPLRGSIYPPLVPWWRVWFCLYVRGLSGSLKLWQGSGWFCMRLHIFIKTSFIIDTKGLYCVTKGNISFSSLLFCFSSLCTDVPPPSGGTSVHRLRFRSADFLLWVLLLIAVFLSKLCGQPLSINRFLRLKCFLREVSS